jgi:hypothetical protein
MFISRAASRRLCLSSILFVAFPVCPSGNMNVFRDGCPVSSRSSGSSSGAAPEVAPESKKANLLDFLFCRFCAQCAAILLGGFPVTISDMAFLMLV